MIKGVQITQKIIKAEITSGARKTVVSVKSGNRVKGYFVGVQGPAGRDGAAENRFDFRAVAQSNLSGHRAVRLNADGKFEYAALTVDSVFETCGITVGAISQNQTGVARSVGVIDEGSWAWQTGAIFLAADGILTQTPPTSGYLLEVARAISATKILVSIKQPIKLL